jgi:DNA invertase Pin-like site-specific DNA recombinase
MASQYRTAIFELHPTRAKGRSRAKARSVKFGRKPKMTPDRLSHARKLIDQGKTPTEAAKIIGVGRATLYGALQREAA